MDLYLESKKLFVYQRLQSYDWLQVAAPHVNNLIKLMSNYEYFFLLKPLLNDILNNKNFSKKIHL
jgi:hypothetical protein